MECIQLTLFNKLVDWKAKSHFGYYWPQFLFEVEASKIYIAMSCSNFRDNRLKLWTNVLEVVVVVVEIGGGGWCLLSVLPAVCMPRFQQIYLHKLCTRPCCFSTADHKHTVGVSFLTALDSSKHALWVNILRKWWLSADDFIFH